MEASIHSFEQCTNKTPMFCFSYYKNWGKVTDVYDGDTCKIVLDTPMGFRRFNARLSGIDTPEIRGGADKEAALRSRDRLIELICSFKPPADIKKKDIPAFLQNHACMVWVDCHQADKYGRLLVDLRKEEDAPTFTSLLIEEGFGYPYDGGKKRV
jgi:endonuclease YncB( thermonuclease family)